MISSYVRRLRLGMELRALRAEHNYTQARVARIIGKSRMEISRLENGQSADLADALNILEGLGVEDERWTALEAIARDACTPVGGTRSSTLVTGKRLAPIWRLAQQASGNTSKPTCRACFSCPSSSGRFTRHPQLLSRYPGPSRDS
jgi:transcriptional regulator with XRE-family HTH domain